MRCANPACQAEALYLRSGSIYCIDREGARPGVDWAARQGQRQLIWLCDDCSPLCVVETWRQPGEQLRWQRKQPVRPRLVAEFPLERKVAA